MTQFTLRGWAYISVVVMLCAALYWLLKTSTVIGLAVLILGVGSLYIGLFAKIAYDSKLRDEEHAVREAVGGVCTRAPVLNPYVPLL